MDTDEWCDFSDMPKLGCEHCHPVVVKAEERSELGPIVVARFTSKCPVCDGAIEPGDHIGKIVQEDELGEWAHYGCGR